MHVFGRLMTCLWLVLYRLKPGLNVLYVVSTIINFGNLNDVERQFPWEQFKAGLTVLNVALDVLVSRSVVFVWIVNSLNMCNPVSLLRLHVCTYNISTRQTRHCSAMTYHMSSSVLKKPLLTLSISFRPVWLFLQVTLTCSTNFGDTKMSALCARAIYECWFPRTRSRHGTLDCRVTI